MPDGQPLIHVIAENRQRILAAVNRAGYPHLTNELNVCDAGSYRPLRRSGTHSLVVGRSDRRGG
jgi:hypothetical protein